MPYSEVSQRHLIPSEDKIIWRYMDFQKFEYLIQNSSLYFSRTDKFGEYEEGVLTKFDKTFIKNLLKSEDSKNWRVNYQNHLQFYESFRSKTYISCWTDSQTENIHLWKNFSDLYEGVAIKTTVGKLKSELDKSTPEDNCFLSKIKYIDPISDTITYFNTITIFSTKILEYKNENEIRAIIQRHKSTDEKPPHIDVKINPFNLIDKVVVSPLADNNFINKMENFLSQTSIDLSVEKSAIALQ